MKKQILVFLLLSLANIPISQASMKFDPWFTEKQQITGALSSGEITYTVSTYSPNEGDKILFTLTSNTNDTITVHFARVTNYRGNSFIEENTTKQLTFPSSYTWSTKIDSYRGIPQTLGIVLYRDGMEIGRHTTLFDIIPRPEGSIAVFLDKEEYNPGEKGILTISNTSPHGYSIWWHQRFERKYLDMWCEPLQIKNGDSILLMPPIIKGNSNVTRKIELPTNPGYYRIVQLYGWNKELTSYAEFAILGNTVDLPCPDLIWKILPSFNYRLFAYIFTFFALLSTYVLIHERLTRTNYN